ncbi:MAG: ribosome maturation factor RimM [Prevotellaceae bacterium]|jgi:16S rRNA processing protein RimM|nr:ribosome maturation factor RimM [Prevotellaceae bacterium]
MILQENLAKIGKTIKAHGISGEILCAFSVDFSENFLEYFIIEDDGIFVPFFVEKYRSKGNFDFFVKFCNINNESEAKILCQKEIFTDKKLDFTSGVDSFSIDFFVGYKIIDENFGEIGVIDYVDESTINTLFAVGEQLIPVSEEYIININYKKKIIHTVLPEGLLGI